MKRICLFCGAKAGDRAVYAAAASELGRTLAARRMTLVYGGGSVGLMKIAAESALAAGGAVIGVITEQLMVHEVGHVGLDELLVVPSMHERKKLMADRADAFVALPGGFGTFDELCEMATWNQLGIHAKPLVLVNLEGYFDGFLAQLDRAVEDGILRREHRTILTTVTRVADVFDALDRWQAPEVPKGLLAAAPPRP